MYCFRLNIVKYSWIGFALFILGIFLAIFYWHKYSRFVRVTEGNLLVCKGNKKTFEVIQIFNIKNIEDSPIQEDLSVIINSKKFKLLYYMPSIIAILSWLVPFCFLPLVCGYAIRWQKLLEINSAIDSSSFNSVLSGYKKQTNNSIWCFWIFCLFVTIIGCFASFAFTLMTFKCYDFAQKVLPVQFIRKNFVDNKKIPPDEAYIYSYTNRVGDKIHSNTKPYKGNVRSKDVTVRFSVAKNGQLLDAVIFRSSGDEKTDNFALETIRNSSPFEPLPEQYQKDYLLIDSTMSF